MKIKGRSKRNRRRQDPFLRRAGRAAARLTLIAILLGGVVFGGYSAQWVYKWAVTTPYFTLRTINVTGNVRVSDAEVIKLSAVAAGRNIFSFSSAEAVRNVKKNPWVDEVRLKRKLPDTLSFEIKERRPMAIVKMDRLYVMDSSGVIFKKLSASDGVDLPVITGLDRGASSSVERDYGEALTGLLRLLEKRDGFNATRVSEINVDPEYGFTICTLDEGVRLRLGRAGFEERLKRFERILALRKGSLRGIRSMDLDSDTEVVVRFKTAVVKGDARI
ncbi:MAG: cell division protein FtsQ/DivIB [Thermodesulfobacteriota bacterium]